MQGDNELSQGSYREREKARERVCSICQSIVETARQAGNNDLDDLRRDAEFSLFEMKKKAPAWVLDAEEEEIRRSLRDIFAKLRLYHVCQSLVNYARRLAGTNGADDLLQDSLTRVLNRKSLDWLLTEREQAITAYTKRTIRNLSCDIARRGGRFTNIEDTVVDPAKDYDPTHTKYLSAAIEEAIPDERRREIFEREHFYGESMVAIAERLGVERTTIWRAKQGEDRSDSELLARIRLILEREGYDYNSFYQLQAVEPRCPLTT